MKSGKARWAYLGMKDIEPRADARIQCIAVKRREETEETVGIQKVV
jgi:hypothetical protein